MLVVRFCDSVIIRYGWNNPVRIKRDGVWETHRIIVTMWKMDTQEWADFTNTKNINDKLSWGCSKCRDTRHQLTDPNRWSFHYPRSDDDMMEIAGVNDNDDDKLEEDAICKTFADWNKQKGCGYTHPLLSDETDRIRCDPHWTIVGDIDHGCKNVVEQLFATTMRQDHIGRDEAFAIFQYMQDVFILNHIAAKLTGDNWKNREGYLSDISLEIAPFALV